MRPYLGPGLVLAIIASVAVWWLGVGSPAPPPRVEPAPIPASAPDPDWLIKQDLGLDASQRQELTTLHTRWTRDTANLRTALDEAQRAMRESPSTIQEAAPAYSDLSRQLTTARQAWWTDASRLLTPQQRETAERQWVEHLRGRR